MIHHIGTWKPRWTLLAVLFATLLGAVTLTDAQQPLSKQQIRAQIDMLERDILMLKEAEKVAQDEPEESLLLSPFPGQRILYSSPTRDSSESKSPGAFDDFYGTYVGFEGDKPIAFELYRQHVTRNVPETRADGQIVYMPVTETLSQIAIYKNCSQRNEGEFIFERDRNWYSGSFTMVKENQLHIELFEYYVNNKEKKPVPETLKTLTVIFYKVLIPTPSGEMRLQECLASPKNDVWDEIRVKKMKEGLLNTPSAVQPTTPEKEQSIIRTYFFKNADRETVLQVMRTTFAETPDVRLALDPKTNHLVVLGPASVHEKVVEVLKTLDGEDTE